jgi:hypothetical protein
VLLVSLGFAEVRFLRRAFYDSSRTFPFVIVPLLLRHHFLASAPALALYTYLVLFLHAPTFRAAHFNSTSLLSGKKKNLCRLDVLCVIASKAQALQARRSFPNLHFLLPSITNLLLPHYDTFNDAKNIMCGCSPFLSLPCRVFTDEGYSKRGKIIQRRRRPDS